MRKTEGVFCERRLKEELAPRRPRLEDLASLPLAIVRELFGTSDIAI